MGKDRCLGKDFSLTHLIHQIKESSIMRTKFLLTFISFYLLACDAQMDYPDLAKELNTMREKEQKLREKYVSLIRKGKDKTLKFEELALKIVNLDRQNTARMKEIVTEYGWPTIKAVGKKGSNSAWLLVQHADRDPIFQWECLQLLEKALAQNEVDSVNYAFLYDRVQIAWGKKQRFATQTNTNDYTNTPFFQPIEDESNVQQRRKLMGIDQQIKEYAQSSGFSYTVPTKEEAKERESVFERSYRDNIAKAKEAYDNGKYRQAADFYMKASYSNGHMSIEDYVSLASSISKADYEEKAYWGYRALLIASINGWSGISKINTNPDLENLRKATPNNWTDLEHTAEQIAQGALGTMQ